MSENSRKVFVLGIDGGSWSLLGSLMDQGYMPNLKKVCENGVSGFLQSTCPPYTGPAWVSSITGMNPGKHGVFGFTSKRKGESNRALVSSRTIKAPKIWQYLEKAGKRAGLINVPVTYPVERLNGFMIPGFLTPQEKRDFTYPATLYKELLQEIGTYIINVRIAGRKMNTEEQFNTFIDDIIFCTRKRFQAMKVLWSKYSPDYFMIVFTCLDKLQHMFWKFMDRENPLYLSPTAKKARSKLFEVYEVVDEIIGYIIREMDKTTTLYIISDHGFGPYEKRVYLNKWLSQQGLLSLKKSKLYMNKLVHKMGLKKIRLPNRHIGIAENPIDGCIDFTNTLFFSSDVYEQGIYFNEGAEPVQKGVSYEEARLRLRDNILALKDPSNGELFVDEVRFREEVFWGPHVNQAPDLLLKMKDYGYLLNKSIPVRGDGFLQEVKGPQGCHRSEGIFAAYGEGVCQNKKLNASIMDIAPTVLYNMNIPVPKQMDGKVLQNIFTSEFQDVTDVRYSETRLSTDIKQSKDTEYSLEEETEVKNRLRELGYLD